MGSGGDFFIILYSKVSSREPYSGGRYVIVQDQTNCVMWEKRISCRTLSQRLPDDIAFPRHVEHITEMHTVNFQRSLLIDLYCIRLCIYVCTILRILSIRKTEFPNQFHEHSNKIQSHSMH